MFSVEPRPSIFEISTKSIRVVRHRVEVSRAAAELYLGFCSYGTAMGIKQQFLGTY